MSASPGSSKKPLHDPIVPPERDPPNKPMHDPPGDLVPAVSHSGALWLLSNHRLHTQDARGSPCLLGGGSLAGFGAVTGCGGRRLRSSREKRSWPSAATLRPGPGN
jgi:hypothetical protein